MPRDSVPVPPALRRPIAPDVPRLALRPEEAARSLGVCERTLRDLADGPPVVRLGRVVLYPIPALERWLADRLDRGSEANGPADPPGVGRGDGL